MSLLTEVDYAGFPYLEPDYRYPYGDDEQQFAELYLPATTPPRPVIVLVHGGCYYEMYDLKPVSAIARELADDGFAVWNIEYRRAGNGGDFPNMFLDVGAAADYLREVAEEHELDLAGVIALGHSAGGHLALWLAGRPQLAATSPLYSADPLLIAGVVGLAPLPDIALALDEGMCGPALPLVAGRSGAESDARLQDTSPRDMLPLGVPQIHIVGTEDQQILRNVEGYLDATEAAGDAVTLVTLEGAGHFEVVSVDAAEWAVVPPSHRRLEVGKR